MIVRDERGAVIVQASLIMIVLFGISAFVVDYGILWMARVQAQNAADAGAMAGALSRAYDVSDPSAPPSAGGIIEQSARSVAEENDVWFENPGTMVFFQCPADVTGGRCVGVNVHRDGTNNSNPLPTIFGPLINVTTQRIGASATAQVRAGNATTCMKPWAIPDRWIELNPVPGVWAPGAVFNKYVESGPNAGEELLIQDGYTAPSDTGSGSGLTFAADLGRAMTLSWMSPNGTPDIEYGSMLPLALRGGGAFAANITGCSGRLSRIGQLIATGSPSDQAPTGVGLSALLAADPAASWSSATNTVVGSCAPTCAPVSPRLFAIAVFDAAHYQRERAIGWTGCVDPELGPGVVPCVKVVNIVGFFLDSVVSGDGVGYIARYPGSVTSDTPSITTLSSLLPAVTLVR